MDESATMREFTQTLGNLTTALATMSSRMDQLEQAKANSVDITSAQTHDICLVSPAYDQGWG